MYGSITASPIAIFEGEATSGAIKYENDQIIFFIGDGTGDVLRLTTSQERKLTQISRKPKPVYDCGRVKKVKVRENGNVVVAWERCLVEEQGIFINFIHFYPLFLCIFPNNSRHSI